MFLPVSEDRFGDSVGVCVREATRELGIEAPVVPAIAWASSHVRSDYHPGCPEFSRADGVLSPDEATARAACSVLGERLQDAGPAGLMGTAMSSFEDTWQEVGGDDAPEA